jgi:ketopantoate hydroxymethyltransferase
MTWWFLRKEIIYLHAKFQDSGQAGAFMVDIETVYQALGECLTEDMSSWSCRSIGE